MPSSGSRRRWQWQLKAGPRVDREPAHGRGVRASRESAPSCLARGSRSNASRRERQCRVARVIRRLTVVQILVLAPEVSDAHAPIRVPSTEKWAWHIGGRSGLLNDGDGELAGRVVLDKAVPASRERAHVGRGSSALMPRSQRNSNRRDASGRAAQGQKPEQLRLTIFHLPAHEQAVSGMRSRRASHTQASRQPC